MSMSFRSTFNYWIIKLCGKSADAKAHDINLDTIFSLKKVEKQKQILKFLE